MDKDQNFTAWANKHKLQYEPYSPVWIGKDLKSAHDFGFQEGRRSNDDLLKLCQMMFDPENQPPQLTIQEAWQKFNSILDGQ